MPFNLRSYLLGHMGALREILPGMPPYSAFLHFKKFPFTRHTKSRLKEEADFRIAERNRARKLRAERKRLRKAARHAAG